METTSEAHSGTLKRKSLQTLQVSATNNKVLVGASGPHTLKNACKIKTVPEKELVMPLPEGRKFVEEKRHAKVEIHEGNAFKTITCDFDELSAEYWSTIAERRRLALVDVVAENERLRSEISELKAQLENKNNEIALLTPMANEAKHLAVILQGLTDGIEESEEVSGSSNFLSKPEEFDSEN